MSQDKRKNSKVPELTSSGGIEKVHQKSSKKKNRTVSKGHVEEARKGDKLPAPASGKEQIIKSQGKASNEIDDLFKDLQSKKKTVDDTKMQKEEKKDPRPGPEKKVEGSKDDIFGIEAAEERKRTEEGYRIYTEEELGFGKKGGSTALCPFDCQCCF